MKKKFMFILLLFFVFFGVVNANTSTLENPGRDYFMQKIANNTMITNVSFEGDIAVIQAKGFITGYATSTNQYVNNSLTRRFYSTATTYYVSVMNGQNTFWVYDDGQITGSSLPIKYGTVNVTTSCSLNKALNATGAGQVETCGVVKNGTVSAVDKGAFITCASGYQLVGTPTPVSSTCVKDSYYKGQKLDQRYCKIVYSYNCQKTADPGTPATPSATLASLSVSAGSLSPGFSSGTKSYKVSVGANVDSIDISATASAGSTFVDGYGPRTVKLNYGNNGVQIKVKNSAGAVTTYGINIYRTDGRSHVNTVESLTISSGMYAPMFNKERTTYNSNVGADVVSVNVNAVLSDPTSRFADGYGPRTVTLNDGLNVIDIKVISQSGRTRTYTIHMVRNNDTGNTQCSMNASEVALLKELEVVSDIEGLDLEKIDFKEDVFTYNIKVPYEVGSVGVKAYTKIDGDGISVNGQDNLEVNIEKTVSVVVTSKDCPGISKTYTIGITRQPEYIKGSDASIADIIVEDHDEFKYEANEGKSYVRLGKKEKSLNIKVVPTDENATCTIVGNEKLKKGSEITITCTSEDEISEEKYIIEVEAVAKGTNVFLIILLVIIVLLVITYFVLRLLGYKIYFNFAAIGAFFRGLGQKFKNMFDK